MNLGAPTFVAQTGSLLYRGLATRPTPRCRLPVGDTAGCQPALP
jgi:hypothetical protein